MSALEDIAAEIDSAHAKHGEDSMLGRAHGPDRRLAILTEEVGEVARELNEAALRGRPVDPGKLYGELIQVAAMATAWAQAIR